MLWKLWWWQLALIVSLVESVLAVSLLEMELGIDVVPIHCTIHCVEALGPSSHRVLRRESLRLGIYLLFSWLFHWWHLQHRCSLLGNDRLLPLSDVWAPICRPAISWGEELLRSLLVPVDSSFTNKNRRTNISLRSLLGWSAKRCLFVRQCVLGDDVSIV